MEKRVYPVVIDGVWYPPNACIKCCRWLPGYKEPIPVEYMDKFCWGHTDDD